MAAPKPPTPEETALADAENLLGLWLRTRQFFAKANTEEPITREEEQQFQARFQDSLAPARAVASRAWP